MELPEVIKHLRSNKGFSQRELAKILNVSPSTIAMYETGQRAPDTETIKIFADFFNVTTDYLLGRTANPKPLASNDGDEFRPTPEDELLIFYKARDLSEESQKLIKEQIEHLHRLERERWERQKAEQENE